jgi:TolB-like protein/DNA-binding SARP family transcriptional activator/tetratricopeptide (TPR) repeat protein
MEMFRQQGRRSQQLECDALAQSCNVVVAAHEHRHKQGARSSVRSMATSCRAWLARRCPAQGGVADGRRAIAAAAHDELDDLVNALATHGSECEFSCLRTGSAHIIRPSRRRDLVRFSFDPLHVFRFKLLAGVSLEGSTGLVRGRIVQRRQLALLALLAGSRTELVSRDKVTAMLWPGAAASRARALLSDAVHILRKSLGHDAVVACGDDLALNSNSVWCDVPAFRAAIGNGDLAAAVALYKAPFLDGFHISGAAEFERWVDAERGELQREARRAAGELTADAQQAGEYRAATHWARRALAIDPYDEVAARELIRLLALAGDRAGAVQAHESFAGRLRADLELEVSTETEVLIRGIRAADLSRKPSDAAAGAVGQALSATAPAGLIAGIVVGPTHGSSEAEAAGLRGSPVTRIESLAVLPLENLSADPEQEYFAAGMHDALIGELAQIDALRVISRTSAMCFQGSRKSMPEIARDLNVDAILEGSVLRAGGRVRIQLQLVQARPEERHLWTRSYDREIDDVLALHREVTRAVATEISVQLMPKKEARLARERRVNPVAYEAYLRGNFHINKFTPESFRLGLAYLRQAADEEPSDPLPHAALALGYSQFGHESGNPGELFPLAKAAAVRALELDDTLAEAHEALAETKLYWEWDWHGAESAFERALEINQNLALVHAHRGWYFHLRRRWEEGVTAMQRAHELDPLVPLFPAWVGWQLRLMGRHDEAVEHARASLELQKDFSVGLYVLGFAYSAKGMYDEAIACHRDAGEASASWAWGLGHTYALAGRVDEAREVIAELKKMPTPMTPFGLAEIHTALRDPDEAFHWLEVAFASRFSWVPWIPDYPTFASLSGDPRFIDLVQRLRLPDPWSPHPARR